MAKCPWQRWVIRTLGQSQQRILPQNDRVLNRNGMWVRTVQFSFASEMLQIKKLQESKKWKTLLLSSGWQRLGKKDHSLFFCRIGCNKRVNEAVKNCLTPLVVIPCLSHLVLISFYTCFLWECCTYFVLAKNKTGRAGCDVKTHLTLPTGQAAPTSLTACIYPASKPGFVRWNWKVIMPSFLDHISVRNTGSASPAEPPRQHCQRENEDDGSLVGGSKIKQTNTWLR